MFSKLNEVELRFNSIEEKLSSKDTIDSLQLFQQLSREHKSLEPLVLAYREFKRIQNEVSQNDEIIRSESGELKTLAQEENKSLKGELETLERKLKILLLPKDPNDEKNILLEIRAGAGGDEAGIFAGELFKLYSKFAEKNRWTVELMSMSSNDVGGFKDIICLISGEKVYSRLKYESGVHRVQRVPKTETQGRIHTSTVTVAVLPEAEDVEIDIAPQELRIDVFRSSGPGGQSVNTTDSAVRITHIPSGLVVVCRDEKSQHKNKSKALKILKTRLLDLKTQEQHMKIAVERQSQVGTGDRSEKIRTYNFPQGRITDHRIQVTLYQLDDFMAGHIDELLQQLITHYESLALKGEL